jgi:hypothetical protein
MKWTLRILRQHTFVATNKSNSELPEQYISKLLFLIGQPVRIQVLIMVGVHEPCTFGYCLPIVSAQSYLPA